MNLLDKKWLKYGNKNITVKYIGNNIEVVNDTDVHGFLIFPKIFKRKKNENPFINFQGQSDKEDTCTLEILNKKRAKICEMFLNSNKILKEKYLKYFIIAIYIPSHTKCLITDLSYEDSSSNKEIDYSFFHGETLLVTPGYPTLSNKYNSAFVHTRVKAYMKSGFNVDVAYIDDDSTMSVYEYDGVKIFRGNYFHLREILQKKQYKRILIHFFDNKYANVLESLDLSNTQLYFYLHGAETLYRDWPKIVSPYFGEETIINSELEKLFKNQDFFIKKYNERKNAKWVFVTPWTQKRCEELLGINFNNAVTIPCLVDTKLFSYEKKDINLRKKIFVLRKFDNKNSYSLDTVVRVILELSRRKIFNDIEFDIYGDGTMYDEILHPLKQFKNVYLHQTFLTHKQIRDVHKTHGIALFPTRFDSQAVSSCEAASSGCAVVTSKIPGVMQFIPEELNVMCEVENYKEYADVIEKMYNEPDYFLEVGKKESESVKSKFDYDHTIKKELELFKKEDTNNDYFDFGKLEDPLLTVIIPSYNVEKYLKSTVISLIDQPLANKLEIIIVNDGSKDNTLKIGRELEKLTMVGNKSIVKVCNKKNGGHGSTINKGIELAKGKYIKIIDGDDTVDSEEFAKLIEILESENSDIILNNYMQDLALDNQLVVKKIYGLMKEKIQYHFDDLCYKNYGFTSWGPILSCSTYKTEMLKNGNFKLSEHMFYVDMELNVEVAILCDTVTYYDLNIYRYLLGREGQSVDMNSYKKNYKHHENVTMNMINIYSKNINKISESRKYYIMSKLILPMISAQYSMCINYFNKGNPFREFDRRLAKFPDIYNNSIICTKPVKFHRRTRGILIKFNDFLISCKSIFR